MFRSVETRELNIICFFCVFCDCIAQHCISNSSPHTRIHSSSFVQIHFVVFAPHNRFFNRHNHKILVNQRFISIIKEVLSNYLSHDRRHSPSTSDCHRNIPLFVSIIRSPISRSITRLSISLAAFAVLLLTKF